VTCAVESLGGEFDRKTTESTQTGKTLESRASRGESTAAAQLGGVGPLEGQSPATYQSRQADWEKGRVQSLTRWRASRGETRSGRNVKRCKCRASRGREPHAVNLLSPPGSVASVRSRERVR